MRPALPVLAFALALPAAAAATAAHGGDPLDAPACRQALQRLQAREDAMASASASASQPQAADGAATAATALQVLRREVLHACLGSRADAPPPTARQPWALPLEVPPLALPLPPAPLGPAMPRTATPAPLPVLPRPAPPATVLGCDPGGCWRSDGTRLPQVAPGRVLGPQGLCTLHGTLLHCPP